MRLPFLHRTAAGLHVAERYLYWVDLHAVRGRITRLRCATEPVTAGEVGRAVRALSARLGTGPPFPFVSAHLNPLLVRHLVQQGPATDEAGAREDWVRAQVGAHLPAGASAEDFVASVLPLERGEEPSSRLLALARREAVEACTAGLQAAGLVPVRMGSVDAEIGNVLAYADHFVEGGSAVLVVREQEASLGGYRDGRLHTLVPVSAGYGACDVLAEELSRLLGTTGDRAIHADRLFVVGEAAEELVPVLAERSGFEGPVLAPVVTFRAGSSPLLLPSTHLAAAALAMKQLFPALGAVDLLEGGEGEAWRQSVERSDALRVMLGCGVLIGMLLLAVSVASAVLGLRQSRTEAHLAQMAGHVAEVEAGRAALARLEEEVTRAERLVTERTGVAVVLERVGRAVPAALWLEAVRLAPGTEAGARLTLEGAALDEESLAAYLDRLEQTPSLADVRLVDARAVPVDAAHAPLAPAGHSLTRFEITCTARLDRHADV